MNKAFALAVLMSAAAMGTAYAREMPVVPDKNVNVIYVDPGEHHENKMLALPMSAIDPTRTEINHAQAEIRRDPGLRAALLRDNVELNNVTGIQSDNAGGTDVYVR